MFSLSCFVVFCCLYLSLFPLISEAEELGWFSLWEARRHCCLYFAPQLKLHSELKLIVKLFASVF